MTTSVGGTTSPDRPDCVTQTDRESKAVLPAVGEITPAKGQTTMADLEQEHVKRVLQFLDCRQLFRVRRGKQCLLSQSRSEPRGAF